MMKWNRPRVMLGLALGEHGIDVAEVHGGSDGARLLRHAHFEIPAETGWDHPEKLGATLRAFLNSHGFTARSVVAGLPGRWLLSRPHAIPPTDEATARGLLRLAVERDFPGNGQELVFDAAGRPSADAAQTILLVATPRQRLNSVTATLGHAGLEVVAVSATALALASAPTGNGAGDPDVLVLTEDGAELAVVRQGRVCAVERLSAATTSMQALAAEVRRVQAGAGAAAPAGSGGLIIWNATGITGAALNELGHVLGTTPRVNPELTGLSGADGGNRSAAAAAAALVLAAQPGRGLPVDFTDSRLADQPPPRVTRARLIAAITAAVVVVGVLYLVGDWYAQHRAVENLTEQLAGMKAEVATARTNVDHLHLVRGWYESRPPMLDCIRALTLAFPGNGQVWTSSLSLRDDMTGTLTGKATDEKTVLDLMDRLKSSGPFAAVKLQQLRQDTHGVSFSVTFLFMAAG